MATLADSLVSSSARPLALRMRPDLTARKQTYLGKVYWVVKEPVGLQYFRFQMEEYAILKMLDGKTSLDEIKERFEQEFTPQKITLADLHRFVGMLHASGLIISNVPGQGPALKRRRDEKRWKEFVGKLSNVLAISFKGFDPERILNGLYPLVRWVFSPLVLLLSCALGITALTLIVVQFDYFYSQLPAFHEFFGPKNWLLLGATLAVTKILHEFGHALSCKHFGGECHEMGVMILVLTPCLYCNVSDSWMLPNKWHRAAIGAAGIFVELFLASVATLVWWYTEPGMLNHLCLRVMFISSVSTLMFNGNPLLRYDGYYILADVMEIPNMRQKASSVLQRTLATVCLGLEMPEDPFLPQRNRFLFGAYAVASNLYRWFVVISILMFLNKVFEPYGLKIIGQAIALMGVFGLVVMPLWKLGKFLHAPGRMAEVKKPRLYATVGAIVAVVALIAMVPLPHRIRCAVEIRARDEESVFVEIPGRLEEVYVRPGSRIEKGEPIARLANVDLQLALTRLVGERDENQVQLTNLKNLRFSNPDVAREIPSVEESLATIEQQLKEKRRDLARLKLTAPVAGIVLPPPSKPPRPAPDGRLGEWTGSPFDAKNVGTYLTESDLFCQVGSPAKYEAVLIVDQGDMDLVDLRQPVSIKLDAYPGSTFEGKVQEIAKGELVITPRSLSSQAGGDVATRTDESGVQRPLSASYQARVPLEDDDGLLTVGLRGRAKIYTRWQPFGRYIWRYVATTFRFRL